MSQYSDQIGFAAGTLVGTRTDLAGQLVPVRFGILQDVDLQFTADLKEAYGQNRYAIALAPGKTKVELKAKTIGVRGRTFNDLYFATTTSSTRTQFADNEKQAVSSTAPYQMTVANAGTFVEDKGIINAATGAYFQAAAVASPGFYSVNPATGVYTFAAGDATVAGGLTVYASYTWSQATGIKIPISNIRMGVGPSFKVTLYQPFDGRSGVYTFNQCQSSKLSFPTKQDDFTIYELDFMVAADIAGNIGEINLDVA